MRSKLIAKLHILLNQKGVDKELFLSDNFGKSSSKELTDGELINAINALDGKKIQHSSYVAADDATRKLRSEILALITKSPHATNARERGLGVTNDWSVLNPWIERKSGGKRLNQMSFEELKAFRKQVIAIRAKGWFSKDSQSKPQAASTIPPTPEPQKYTAIPMQRTGLPS